MVVLFQAIVSGALMGLFYALLAAGFALIFGVVRVFNLAHGELILIGAYLGYGLWISSGIGPLWSILGAAALTILVGLIAYKVISRASEPFELNSLVLTFGLSLFFQNLLLILMTGNYRIIVSRGLEWSLALGPLRLSIGRLVVGGLSLVSLVALSFVLNRTRLGKAMRATSQDREAASLMGIDVARVDLYAFAIGAGIAGMARPLYATLYYIQPAAGIEATLIALILTIFGGGGEDGRPYNRGPDFWPGGSPDHCPGRYSVERASCFSSIDSPITGPFYRASTREGVLEGAGCPSPFPSPHGGEGWGEGANTDYAQDRNIHSKGNTGSLDILPPDGELR